MRNEQESDGKIAVYDEPISTVNFESIVLRCMRLLRGKRPFIVCKARNEFGGYQRIDVFICGFFASSGYRTSGFAVLNGEPNLETIIGDRLKECELELSKFGQEHFDSLSWQPVEMLTPSS